MSKNENRLLGHSADNDGIDEYDNALPDWWLGLFFFSVVWGIGYAVEYHLVSNRSQTAAYEAEMAAAKQRWPDSGPKVVVMDAASIDAGRKVFMEQCAACHAATLTGGIGPSLVDATWIHGARPEEIQNTVTNGVAAKGMPAWGPVLGPDKVAKVVAFVRSEFDKTGLTPVAATAGAPQPVAAAADQTGEQIWTQNCVACHGADMKGLVGPSLVDTTWIHGGTLEDITRTITNGVPEKGMVSWGPVLGEERIKLVAQFVFDRNQAATKAN